MFGTTLQGNKIGYPLVPISTVLFKVFQTLSSSRHHFLLWNKTSQLSSDDLFKIILKAFALVLIRRESKSYASALLLGLLFYYVPAPPCLDGLEADEHAC